MPIELGIKAIKEAADLGTKWISITGGEPLLEPELTQTYVKHATELGISTEIVTNGFWAETEKAAIKMIESLKLQGLDILNLSLDDFHQEFIPYQSVKNACMAAKSLGFKFIIMTTTTKNNEIKINTIIETLKELKIQVLGGPRIRNPDALLIETPVTPIGRASKLSEFESLLISEVKCGEVLQDIGVGPDGSVYPCCSALAFKKVLGNINKASLESILENAYTDPFCSSIMAGVDVSGSFTSKCHACISLCECAHANYS
jgi:radical SAM protein with 4Fe4S-binding SPASM domain